MYHFGSNRATLKAGRPRCSNVLQSCATEQAHLFLKLRIMSADTLLELPLETPFKAPPPRPSPSRRPPSPPPKAPPLLQTSLALAHLLPDEDDVSIVTVAMQASGEDVLKLRIHRTHTLYDLESTLLCLFQSSWFPGPFPCPRGTSVRVVGLHEQGPLDKVLDLLEAAADDRIRIVCVPQDESKCITRVYQCLRAYDPTSGAEDVLVVLQSKKGIFLRVQVHSQSQFRPLVLQSTRAFSSSSLRYHRTSESWCYRAYECGCLSDRRFDS